jgi:hypothetical protein
MGTVDRIELIGSVQFHLPVTRANAGLMPGEVVFQPHHADAGGMVNRRLIRLAERRAGLFCQAQFPLPRRRVLLATIITYILMMDDFRVRGPRRRRVRRMSWLG